MLNYVSMMHILLLLLLNNILSCCRCCWLVAALAAARWDLQFQPAQSACWPVRKQLGQSWCSDSLVVVSLPFVDVLQL